jgi:hypothetical protein
MTLLLKGLEFNTGDGVPKGTAPHKITPMLGVHDEGVAVVAALAVVDSINRRPHVAAVIRLKCDCLPTICANCRHFSRQL